MGLKALVSLVVVIAAGVCTWDYLQKKKKKNDGDGADAVTAAATAANGADKK